MRTAAVALALFGVSVVPPNSWRVVRGDVRVICPMTIGGSFEATTTALRGSVTRVADGREAFEGALAVDLRTLDTGIGLRNEHLRDHYLEVGHGPAFAVAMLSDIVLRGLDADAPEGRGSFTGSLTLHGITRTVTGSVDIRRAGAGLRVQARFPVRLPDYQISKPRYLGIGVDDTVRVEVAFDVSH